MKIGIVGSRDFGRLELVEEFVGGLGVGDVVVSGGARGVDQLAIQCGLRRGLRCFILDAMWKRYGKRAGILRNEELVKFVDEVVVFWDGVSKGSKNVIELCKVYEKKYTIIYDKETLWG